MTPTPVTEQDLRLEFKRDTGKDFGCHMAGRGSSMYYSDEYVEWLEARELKRINEDIELTSAFIPE